MLIPDFCCMMKHKCKKNRFGIFLLKQINTFNAHATENITFNTF